MKILKLLDEKLEEVFLVIILIAAVVIVAMQVVTGMYLKFRFHGAKRSPVIFSCG